MFIPTIIGIVVTGFVFRSLTLNPENARSLFEKIVDIDGVLIGFTAIVLGIIRVKIKRSLVLVFAVGFPLLFYLLSIFLSFVGIATASTSGNWFTLPISFMILATVLFFGTLAIILSAPAT